MCVCVTTCLCVIVCDYWVCPLPQALSALHTLALSSMRAAMTMSQDSSLVTNVPTAFCQFWDFTIAEQVRSWTCLRSGALFSAVPGGCAHVCLCSLPV